MKLASLLIGALFSLNVYAQETVRIYSPYSPTHSGTPAMFKIIDEANKSQNIYKFVLEFKPGGNQVIALKSMDENSLAIIAPAFVENVNKGLVNESDYIPIHALGDACWAVITNGSLKGIKEVTVGGVGFGNAAHLTALALGEKYGFKVRYIVFKSNNDALVNMAGDNGVIMVVDRYEAYESMKTKNAKLEALAASCPTRLPQAPKLKTTKEIGIDAPFVFNITVAHKSMDSTKRKAIAIMLNDAQRKIGADEIFKLSGMKIPSEDAAQFYTRSTNLVRSLQTKYRKEIEEASK
jgi:tripartite-type tricarboxylate transporter receptor subunit TctC